jgi:pimeloyl-ACP methyl ester carboxylesterase
MIRKLLLWTAALIAVVIAGVLVSSLTSLDWDYAHTNRTAALPIFSSASDGLVRIPARGFEFRARVAGLDGDGTGVILLHGFPETSMMFDPLIAAASGEGHRVVAVDQRGYSPGARPDGVSAYLYEELVADVVAIADAVGFERFHLVGHDWGCIVGWGVAAQNPERVLSYTAMSIPHPSTLIEGMQKDMPSYIQIFNVPGIAETMLSFNDMAGMRNPEIPPALQAEYLAVFSEPGALTAALNWYRGILQSIDTVGSSFETTVTPPVLFMWGTREVYVNDDVRERQRPYVRSLEELELEGGHSIHLDQPEAVVEATLDHIRGADG